MRECGRFEWRNEPQEKEVAGSDEQREISSVRSLRMRDGIQNKGGESDLHRGGSSLAD